MPRRAAQTGRWRRFGLFQGIHRLRRRLLGRSRRVAPETRAADSEVTIIALGCDVVSRLVVLAQKTFGDAGL